MPAAQDHYRFCLAVLGMPAGWTGPETLGTHGPDPFFFFGQLPWKPRLHKIKARALADWMHSSAPADIFVPLARALDSLQTGPLKSLAWRFFHGLVLHYLLDRCVHPYVFYQTGFPLDGQDSGPFAVDHGRFESAMAEARRGDPEALPRLSVQDVRPRRMFDWAPAWLEAADLLYSRAFPNWYWPGLYPKAWRDMRDTLDFLWDPRLIKRRLVAALGGKETMIHAMIEPVPESQRGDIDYLNKSKGPWRQPCTGDVHHETLAELVAQAAAEAREFEKVLAALQAEASGPPDSGDRQLLQGDANPASAPDSGVEFWNKPAHNALVRFLGTINHEGCKAGAAMHYYQSVYRRT